MAMHGRPVGAGSSGEGGMQAAAEPSGGGGMLLALPDALLQHVLQIVHFPGVPSPLRLTCRGLCDAVDALRPRNVTVRAPARPAAALRRQTCVAAAAARAVARPATTP